MLTDNEQFNVINNVHPHIGEKLKSLWGTEDCNIFLNSLFNDTRDNSRKGFSNSVARALFKLMQEHEKACPEKPSASGDVWGRRL